MKSTCQKWPTSKKVGGENLVSWSQWFPLHKGREVKIGLPTPPGIQPEAPCGLGRGTCYVSALKQRTLRGGPRGCSLWLNGREQWGKGLGRQEAPSEDPREHWQVNPSSSSTKWDWWPKGLKPPSECHSACFHHRGCTETVPWQRANRVSSPPGSILVHRSGEWVGPQHS